MMKYSILIDRVVIPSLWYKTFHSSVFWVFLNMDKSFKPAHKSKPPSLNSEHIWKKNNLNWPRKPVSYPWRRDLKRILDRLGRILNSFKGRKYLFKVFVHIFNFAKKIQTKRTFWLNFNQWNTMCNLLFFLFFSFFIGGGWEGEKKKDNI